MDKVTKLLISILVGVIASLIAVVIISGFSNPAQNPPEGAGVIGSEENAPAQTIFIKSDGNVGIGTNSANEKLTVEGVLSLDEVSTPPSATTGYGKVYVKADDGKLYFKDSSGNEFDLTTYTGGTVSAANVSAGEFGSNTGGGDYSFPGNVGIGTTSPPNKLSVYENITGWVARIRQQNANGYGLIVENTEDTSDSKELFKVVDNTDYSPQSLFVIKGSGNVGIGTTSPGVKLEVVGNLKVSEKVLPGSSRLALSVFRTSQAATTSTSWTDVPDMTISIPSTWTGGDVIILYTDVTCRSESGRHNFRITIDGAVVARTHVRIMDTGDQHNVNLHYVGNLSAGAHTIKVQWKKVDGGTIYSSCEGNSDYCEARLSVASIM